MTDCYRLSSDVLEVSIIFESTLYIPVSHILIILCNSRVDWLIYMLSEPQYFYIPPTTVYNTFI